MPPTFGGNLRRLRRLQGVTRLTLADRLALADAASISLWETDTILPGPETIARIAAVLGCTASDLVGAVDTRHIERLPTIDGRPRAPSERLAARKIRAGSVWFTGEPGRRNRSWRTPARNDRAGLRHSAGTRVFRSTGSTAI